MSGLIQYQYNELGSLDFDRLMEEVAEDLITEDQSQNRDAHIKLVMGFYEEYFKVSKGKVQFEDVLVEVYSHNYEVLSTLAELDFHNMYGRPFVPSDHSHMSDEELADEEKYDELRDAWVEDFEGYHNFDISGYVMGILDEYNVYYIDNVHREIVSEVDNGVDVHVNSCHNILLPGWHIKSIRSDWDGSNLEYSDFKEIMRISIL